jgi:ABC-2 type transport system permease protein
MRTVLVLVGNEFRRFAADKAALSLTFIVPLVLIYIFGNVFGVNSEDRGPKGIPLAVVNQTDAPAPAAIISALQKEPAFKVITSHKDANGVERVLTEAEVREMMHAGDIRFALIFPADATSDSEVALKMKFLRNARNEIETETVNGLLQKTIFTAAPQALLASLQRLGANQVGGETMARFNHSLADAVARGFGGDPAEILHSIETGEFNIPETTPTNTNGNSFLDRLIKIEREEIGGEHAKSPMATRSVGGYAVMFLLFSLTGASTSLFDEKKAGLYQRLLAAPVRRTHILWSKYIFGILLGLVQLLTLFVAGRVLFGVDITSNVFNLLLICLAAASACVAFGMLLAALAPTAAAANGMGTLLNRLLVDRRLPPRALGKLQHARAAPGARHPARLRCRREHDQHLAFSPRADLRVAKANALRVSSDERSNYQSRLGALVCRASQEP